MMWSWTVMLSFSPASTSQSSTIRTIRGPRRLAQIRPPRPFARQRRFRRLPLIEPAHIDRLIAAYDEAGSRIICIPVHAGRRGNPVLWSRRFIPEMLELTGDESARRLLDTHPDSIAEVPIPSPAIHVAFDTPEALARL
jgi:hypothetical protein